MRKRERLQATCPVIIDHRLVERALQRVATMNTGDLLSWTSNCSMDMSALAETFPDDPAERSNRVGEMELAHAMLHACLVELNRRCHTGGPN